MVLLHAEAGFEPKQSGSYAPSGWNTGHDDDTAEAAAITEFRRLLGGCVPGQAWILHEMCLGQHPGTWRLATLQAALDDLARRWKVG